MQKQLLNADHCGTGAACYGCGRRLPLRMAGDGEEAVLWECAGCHSFIAGLLSRDVLPLLAKRVRLADRHFIIDPEEPASDAVLEIVRSLASEQPSLQIQEMRRSHRIFGEREAVILPVDAAYTNFQTPILGVVANMSCHGALMVTSTPISTAAAILQIENDRHVVQLLCESVWTRRLERGCYGTGMEFVGRFGKSFRD
jgi:hypothetical protein